MPRQDVRLSRRRFLKFAAISGAAVSAPSLIPASALGKGGAVAPDLPLPDIAHHDHARDVAQHQAH